MSADVPYALGCPACPYFVEVSEEDPDASLSKLHSHLFVRHAGADRGESDRLLAKAADLTEAQAATR